MNLYFSLFLRIGRVFFKLSECQSGNKTAGRPDEQDNRLCFNQLKTKSFGSLVSTSTTSSTPTVTITARATFTSFTVIF